MRMFTDIIPLPKCEQLNRLIHMKGYSFIQLKTQAAVNPIDTVISATHYNVVVNDSWGGEDLPWQGER